MADDEFAALKNHPTGNFPLRWPVLLCILALAIYGGIRLFDSYPRCPSATLAIADALVLAGCR